MHVSKRVPPSNPRQIDFLVGQEMERTSHCIMLPWQQNFWMTTNPKMPLKKWIHTISNFTKLVCQMLAKFSGVKTERTVSAMAKKCTKSSIHMQRWCFVNINLLPFCHFRCLHRHCCLSFLLLWSRNFATMVMWHHTSPFYL